MNIIINEVDKVEILTLQDNYIDLLAKDNAEIVQRARLKRHGSILAEHGFSALVTVTTGKESHSILFDFGFSEHGAAHNADLLDADLTNVRTMALSHGHFDHFGGLQQLSERMGKQGRELVVHPAVFRNPRYIKSPQGTKRYLPSFTREKVQNMGISVIETQEPYPLLDGNFLFLGEIPRHTEFEKGMLSAHYEEDGKEKRDSLEDDTAIVAHVKGKGLVIVSGCAHSGIINTVEYARKLTGIDTVFAVMGGFHLPNSDVIQPTTDALKAIDPEYIVPAHCTGRKAVMHMEKEMPEKFLLNMAGTKLTFSA
jgi:7,8-dihydropterin-6-yl-methyl-4-(beta-D-ribofuranosyl)aminobenzene 5'-phosphate synthase